MSNFVIFYGLLIFFTAMCVHVAIWRFFKPRRLISILSINFLIIPLAAIGFLILAVQSFDAAGVWPSQVEFMAIALLHASLSCAYILTFPAIQARCPTLRMILIISSFMPKGATDADLKDSVNVEEFLDPSLNDLTRSGFMVHRDETYSITRRGKVIVTPFKILRRILGLPMGRG